MCELALGLRLVVRSKVTPRLAPPGPCLKRPAAALAPEEQMALALGGRAGGREAAQGAASSQAAAFSLLPAPPP